MGVLVFVTFLLLLLLLRIMIGGGGGVTVRTSSIARLLSCTTRPDMDNSNPCSVILLLLRLEDDGNRTSGLGRRIVGDATLAALPLSTTAASV